MNDHLIIATAADCQKGYFEALRSQVVQAKIDFMWHTIEDFSWRKLILWELSVASAYPDALIAFCDSWDMLYLGDRSEFIDVVGAQPLLLHSEKRCWPHPDKASLYITHPYRTPQTSPWCYVNGTGPAGRGKDIAAAIEYGMEHYPIEKDEKDIFDITQDNDQRFWTDLFFSGFGKLDSECRLSQSLVDGANGDFKLEKDLRLTNKITGTKPLFAHANGATCMMGFKGLMDILANRRCVSPW